MITLYQFPGIWGLPNASPFCLKIETYLRMIEMPYEIRFVSNPGKAPKGKLPFIKIDEKTLSDSELIIDYLKGKFGDPLDKNLNKEQKALSVLLDNTFSERIYWILIYMRWQNEVNWLQVKNAFFNKLSCFAKLFISRRVRKQILQALYAQGTGRHSYEEVLQMGYKTLDSIAEFLGEKKYFQGDEITSIDATAFAFLANIVWVPYDDALKNHVHKFKNLLSFCERMWNTFYPEIPKPFSLISN
ncbi:glutathione S-transferase family protein [Legionella fairfieldensis]|uniref:glutathione S-transferase family protein n=1 Tax=Legionella fairfieldensis TaxID=45064 RepID=UPI00048B0288|nr:glutathione S-transferase family protein [Legionella fairfieldensis]